MAKFIGTPDDDGILGTAAADRIYGEAGNDSLYGYDGNDRIGGETGNDVISGNAGGDLVVGGDGDDTLYGGDGAEVNADWWPPSRHADGVDRLYGDAGNDYLDGGPGNDRLYGGEGNDFLSDFQGNNAMAGKEGNDQVIGIGRLYGDAGDDGLWGSGKLYGGEGNDWLGANLNAQAVTMNGGAGADSFHLTFWGLDNVAQHVSIDDFKPAEGDTFEPHAQVNQGGVDYAPWLFGAFDTNDDGVIKGDGSDLFSTQTANGLELHYFEDTLAVKNVDHLDATDWLVA